jgi:hypothetical protein
LWFTFHRWAMSHGHSYKVGWSGSTLIGTCYHAPGLTSEGDQTDRILSAVQREAHQRAPQEVRGCPGRVLAYCVGSKVFILHSTPHHEDCIKRSSDCLHRRVGPSNLPLQAKVALALFRAVRENEYSTLSHDRVIESAQSLLRGELHSPVLLDEAHPERLQMEYRDFLSHIPVPRSRQLRFDMLSSVTKCPIPEYAGPLRTQLQTHDGLLMQRLLGHMVNGTFFRTTEDALDAYLAWYRRHGLCATCGPHPFLTNKSARLFVVLGALEALLEEPSALARVFMDGWRSS